MREIKFRAWNENGKLITGEQPESGDLFIEESPEYLESGKEVKPLSYIITCWNDTVIEQFTGMKDKNGVDIYEGDILHRYLNVYWVVRYTIDGYRASPKNDSGLYLTAIQFTVSEVIGNIHENKELIK